MSYPPTGNGPFALRAERLFDGTRFLEIPTVLVAHGRIVAVGADVPGDVDEHDLGSATLLPGLVDCHQHLVFDGKGTLEQQVAGYPDEELLERARRAARTALLGGVTTLRDLGDRSFVTLELRGDPELPTMLCAGPPITRTKGHCWYLGGECEDRDGLLAALRERIDRGCDAVKVMASGGFLTPTTPMWASQFDLGELRLIVNEARAAGIGVAAHCHGLRAISDAIEAGVDTIEHCSFLDESLDVAPSERLLERLALSSTAVSATLGITPGAQIPRMFEEILPKVAEATAKVHALGGRIVVGTDAGIEPFKPHDVAHHAIHDLLAMGMSPLEALRALTYDGAGALNLPHKGRIEPGADADLLAVAGDPEREPKALSRVVQVWKAGRPVHAAE